MRPPPANVKKKAMCVAHSWLTSLGLEVEFSSETTLKVAGNSVNFYEIGEEAVGFNANALASTKQNEVIGELERLLGPIPQLRKQVSARASKTDYEGVALRLCQFAKTPNPPREVFERYQRLVRFEAIKAANKPKFRRALIRMGQDADDLYVIGLVFFVSHWTFYAEKSNDGNLNTSYLSNALRQNFQKWYMVTDKKIRQIDLGTAGVPLDFIYASPVAGAVMSISTENVVEDENYVINRTISYTVPTSIDEVEEQPALFSRTANARQALNSTLAQMPHDDMVEALTRVASSEFQDYQARALAANRLAQHQATCQACSVSKVTENVAG